VARQAETLIIGDPGDLPGSLLIWGGAHILLPRFDTVATIYAMKAAGLTQGYDPALSDAPCARRARSASA